MTKDDASIFKLWESVEKRQSEPYKDAKGNVFWWVGGMRSREDGPAIEWANGTKEWWLNGKRHREGAPAKIYYDGRKEWWLNGNLHNVNGPAAEYPDGSVKWYINDKNFTDMYAWAEAALKYQGNENPSEDEVEQKVVDALAQDILN